ncbi:MAG: PDZ domain-containing protein [Myxococcales bacterium]|nr:PDZ domain-containing protein [Myxococcales bacterium]
MASGARAGGRDALRGRAAWRGLVAAAALLACTPRSKPPPETDAPPPEAVAELPGPPEEASAPAEAPPEPIALVIRDLEGRPIAGAQVVHTNKKNVETGLRSDGEGRVSVPGRGHVHVKAPGHLGLGVKVSRRDVGRELRLLPASTLSLRLVDARGAPVVGATVQQDRGPTIEGRSDARGVLEVGDLGPGRRLLHARAPGLAGDAFVAVGLGEAASAEIKLHPRTHVSGEVVVSDGERCSSGHLNLTVGADSSSTGCPICGGADAEERVMIASDGRFDVELAPGVLYGVEVACDDAVTREAGPLLVGDAAVRDLRWEVLRGQRIAGRFVDGQGRPVAGISFMLRDTASGEPIAEAAGDEGGRFSVGGLLPGSYALEAYSIDDGPFDYETEAPLEIGEANLLDLVVTLESEPSTPRDDGDDDDDDDAAEPYPELRGIVRGPDGAPIAGALIEAAPDRRRHEALGMIAARWHGRPTRSAADGSFTVRSPVPRDELEDEDYPAEVMIVAQVVGGGLGIGTMTSPSEPTTVWVGPTGGIRGAVVDRRGRPVRHFGVDLSDERPRPVYVYAPDGRFEVQGFAPGTYRLRLHTSEADAGQRVVVKAGKVSEAQPTMIRGQVGTLSVLLSGGDGDVRGCKVLCGPAEGGSRSSTSVSDEDGWAQFHEVPSGPTLITLPACTVGEVHYPAQRRYVHLRADDQRIEIMRVVGQPAPASALVGDLGFKTARLPSGDPAMAAPTIAKVLPGGPAAAAGLVVGDRIARVNGQRVSGRDVGLFEPLTRVRRGDEVSLELADGRKLTLRAR